MPNITYLWTGGVPIVGAPILTKPPGCEGVVGLVDDCGTNWMILEWLDEVPIIVGTCLRTVCIELVCGCNWILFVTLGVIDGRGLLDGDWNAKELPNWGGICCVRGVAAVRERTTAIFQKTSNFNESNF